MWRPHRVSSRIRGVTHHNSALFVRNTLSTREEFVERVKRHYAGEVQQQIGKLLGHLSVLGAPLSFVTGLGSSSSDLFRESARSVVRVRSLMFTSCMTFTDTITPHPSQRAHMSLDEGHRLLLQLLLGQDRLRQSLGQPARQCRWLRRLP